MLTDKDTAYVTPNGKKISVGTIKRCCCSNVDQQNINDNIELLLLAQDKATRDSLAATPEKMELNADNKIVKEVAAYLAQAYTEDPETPHFEAWAIDLVPIVIQSLAATPDKEVVELLAKTWCEHESDFKWLEGMSDRLVILYRERATYALKAIAPIYAARHEENCIDCQKQQIEVARQVEAEFEEDKQEAVEKAVKAEQERIIRWGTEPCPHIPVNKLDCPSCLQSLRGEHSQEGK